MSNSIQCRILVKPAPDDLHALLGSEGIDFGVLCPLPDRERETARQVWGCPGQARNALITRREDGVTLAFDTPWTEPRLWIGHLTQQLYATNPHVRLTYAVLDYAGRQGSMSHFKTVTGPCIRSPAPCSTSSSSSISFCGWIEPQKSSPQTQRTGRESSAEQLEFDQTQGRLTGCGKLTDAGHLQGTTEQTFDGQTYERTGRLVVTHAPQFERCPDIQIRRRQQLRNDFFHTTVTLTYPGGPMKRRPSRPQTAS